MGTLSMTATSLHTKYHRPPARSSDLLGDSGLDVQFLGLGDAKKSPQKCGSEPEPIGAAAKCLCSEDDER
jgi:hypothetical protein